MNGPKYRVEARFGLFSVWVYSDRAIVTHVSEEQARAIAKELNSERRLAEMFVATSRQLEAASKRIDQLRSALWAAWPVVNRDGNGCVSDVGDLHPLGCECIREEVAKALEARE